MIGVKVAAVVGDGTSSESGPTVVISTSSGGSCSSSPSSSPPSPPSSGSSSSSMLDADGRNSSIGAAERLSASRCDFSFEMQSSR